ncbi:MAG: aspartate/glutamate racemase family protein [Bacteroidales bacterium]|nr:aspartate/glutamate racemase family protein [Bacteroidales bacterium]
MKLRNTALLLLCLALALTGCKRKAAAPVENIPAIEKALSDTQSPIFVGFDDYPEKLKGLPIGVFDSGTGGLTVLEKILSLDNFDNISGSEGADGILDFAGEHFIYLADQANMPYGVYDACGKADYLRELVVKDAAFLTGTKYYENAFQETPTGVKPRVKIIVIACNTATAYALKDVRSMLEQAGKGVKVIGVINAGVNAVLDQLKDETAPYAIGVLATQGTIASGAYERTIKESVAERGIKTPVTVVNQSGYGFAESVDSEPDYVNVYLTAPRESYRGPKTGTEDADLKEDLMAVYNFDYSDNRMLFNIGPDGRKTDIQLNNAINYARFNLVSLVERHRASGSNVPLKAVILGCTHYPFLIETLNQTIEELRNFTKDGSKPYANLIADDFTFIDPAVYTAIECYTTLHKDGNLAYNIEPMKVNGYISVPSGSLTPDKLTEDGNLTYEFKYGREPGTNDITTKQVPFSKSNIDETNLQRIEKLLPYSYSLIAPAL